MFVMSFRLLRESCLNGNFESQTLWKIEWDRIAIIGSLGHLSS